MVNLNSSVSLEEIQTWLEASEVTGCIDADRDFSVELETNDTALAKQPISLFLNGEQTLTLDTKTETFPFEEQVNTSEITIFKSNYLKKVSTGSDSYSYNLNVSCYVMDSITAIPVILKKGIVEECPIKSGELSINSLKFSIDDEDFQSEGVLVGQKGFVYHTEISDKKPGKNYVPGIACVHKVGDQDETTVIGEHLWGFAEGDTVYVILASFRLLGSGLQLNFSGTAQIEDSDFDEQNIVLETGNSSSFDDDEVALSQVDDVETNEGDIGLFEFQIKRGLVDEDQIEDEDVQNLVDELKQLCDDENYKEAANLLLSNLSFEFGPGDLDDDPEVFFANTEYIEFECSSENTSVKIGYDDCLIVTISVQFEIPLNGGISTAELAEYLPDSGAWASASASPGWGYAGSDGDNVWFLGIKGQ